MRKAAPKAIRNSAPMLNLHTLTACEGRGAAQSARQNRRMTGGISVTVSIARDAAHEATILVVGLQ
jgi:hypothetical protein